MIRPVELLILTVLAEGDRHGYGIRQAIIEQTHGRTTLEAGNLYRHIRRLEEDGLLAEAAAPARESDERRIYYRLTAEGRRALTEELRRLRSLVRHAESSGIIARSRA